jgi:hypothetical protein
VCGFDDVRALCIDHVNGGGTQEQLRFGGKASITYYRYVRDKISAGSDAYQVLCSNHNAIKRYERNECGAKWKDEAEGSYLVL